MKRIVSLAFVAMISLFGFAPNAMAQIDAGCAWVGQSYGRPAYWNCDRANQYSVGRAVIIRNEQPGMMFRPCTAGEELARDGLMALRGGLAGVLIGDNHRAAGLGAGLGLLYSMGRDCRVAVPAVRREYFSNPGRVYDDEVVYERRPRILGHQVVRRDYDDDYEDRPRAHRYPADCDVGNSRSYPDLQNLDVSEKRCATLRRAERHTHPGHCLIDGVNYPELVGDEARCLAKRAEVARNANQKAEPKTYGKIADAARDAEGHPCFVGNKQGDLLADFMVETKNPYGELATSGPKCKALVERFRQDHGGAIAKN